MAYWRARRALTSAQTELDSEKRIAFTVGKIEPQADPGFEWISAPALFSSAIHFQDKLFISGPAGLFAYSSRGELLKQYLVGRELPASPLGQLALGTLADSRRPELLIATESEGVLAFDGADFRQIRPRELPGRNVTAILPLASGRLLMGTQKSGVLDYDGREITLLHGTLARISVTALAGDENGIWIGTLDQGLLHFHAGQTDRFAEADGLPDLHINALAIAGDKVYAGTPVGVAEFRDNKLSRVIARGAFVNALLPRAGQLLIGALDSGVQTMSLERSRPIAVNIGGGAALPGKTVLSGKSDLPEQADLPGKSDYLPEAQQLSDALQLFEADGSVFALTRDALYEVGRGSARRVLARSDSQLTDRNVSALSVDPAGALWVGYFDRGLDIVTRGRTQHIENERAFCINRIVQSGAGDGAYVATANGLLFFDSSGREREDLKRADGLIADHVTDVIPYRDGIAIATPAGLTFLDKTGVRSLYAFHGLVNNHVYALGADHGTLLAGTLGGLSMFDGEKIAGSLTTANSGLKHNWITAIVPMGDQWMVGTYGSGVMRLDSTGHFQAFETATGPLEINPNAMLATAQHIFAGTLGGGLYVYNRESQRWQVVHAGLPAENVTAMAANGGYIYIGTDNGLVRIAEQRFQ